MIQKGWAIANKNGLYTSWRITRKEMILIQEFALGFVKWYNEKSWEHDYREQRTHTDEELIAIYKSEVARLLPSKEETREMTPIDPLPKAVFSLDIQRLRATQTDAEFRRLLFQMLDQKTINQ